MPDWNRPRAICPGCLSQERHRALWWHFANRSHDVFDGGLAILHFAPEYKLEQRLRSLPHARYMTADLASPLAELKTDITEIPLEDEAFDVIICSHVLEHVADDAAALRELRRVLKPGGRAYLMVPIDNDRATTYEDAAITSPEQRRDAYWQADHVRLYGQDFASRVSAAGFDVTTDVPADDVAPALARRYGLIPEDVIFVARR
jgi:SAM-dependent methyltransferase